LFSCSFISSISFCILSICSFAWLSFFSFSEAFLFASSWFANLSFSFWSCCIFCCTISSSLSTAWSSSSWASCSVNGSRACVVFSALAFWRASSLPFVLDLWCVKVLEWERFCCHRHGSALLGQSQWERSSWTCFVVA
jgi:hypothetical protein